MTQQQYKRNLRLVNWLSAFNTASFFVPFAVPFWLSSGLTQQKIYLLQSVFTIVMIVLEIPTGMISDRIGRRPSLIAASLLAATGFGFYSLAHGFWQFAVAEILLALGLSFNSGTINSMRHESVIASGSGESGRKTAGAAHTASLMAAAITAALSGIVVKYYGFRVTMLLDGLTYLAATWIALRMTEPPRLVHQERAKIRSVKPLLVGMASLIGLFALLREATHIPVFLNARILQNANIDVGWFGAIFASASLVSVVVSHYGHRLEAKLGERRIAVLLVGIGCGSYLATGTLSPQLAPLGIFGFSVMFALTKPFMDHALNSRIHDNSVRATINSCATLVARVLYLVAGPLVGGIVDVHGAQQGYVTTGIFFGIFAAVALLTTKTIMKRR